ncbi:ATP-binding protein [Streptomyces sp. NBC_00201]|uniref:AlbA family DNA-binding domain-containing protein n=1 Tax=unclassified Streptomyces TaxID=2593676 RepID=UPI0022511B91|nr:MULTISPECIES: ATP-binding protein [unclassified Streptomyces]MCX5063746.1 ATP-binding protein [Streptomyces sp. NBC_00452]MCX5251901.1 ATP-binding protein [Streptomyces sp. NBC_00201]MCX5294196.1 ATP-binding protein [Streptomyces sp. NBC_00183]
MVALRSRRLEGLFGAPLDTVSYTQIAALKTNSVSESYDLEFKGELYGGNDKAKRDLAGDVAALANTAGGVLLLGVAEDDQARAAELPGVALSDSEVLRYRSIVADMVHPLPTFDVRQIEDPDKPGQGLLMIAVLRSPSAPHGVLVNEGLRYPRRNGASIIYLSESEVAAAYQDRFARRQTRHEDLLRYEGDLISRLDVSDQTYVVVTLVPDLGGDFTLDTSTLRAFQQETRDKDLLVFPRGVHVRHVMVGSRRLIAHGGREPAKASWIACELHQSGAGSFAALASDRASLAPPGHQDKTAAVSRILDEDLVVDIWSGLRLLARHARDRAAAGGPATVSATICPVAPELPAELRHPRGHIGGQLGTHQTTETPRVTSVFDIDDLAENGPALIAATSAMSAGLIQHFGYPETPQMTTDGMIRSQYWSAQRYGPAVREWAAQAEVVLSDETLD